MHFEEIQNVCIREFKHRFKARAEAIGSWSKNDSESSDFMVKIAGSRFELLIYGL